MPRIPLRSRRFLSLVGAGVSVIDDGDTVTLVITPGGGSPGGELGGTWAAPTVDPTHSGSSHAGVVSTHEAASDPHPAYVKRLAGSAAQLLIENTVAETDVVSCTVPAGLLEVGDVLNLRAHGTIFNNTGGAVTFTFRLKFGATTMLATTAIGMSSAGTRRKFFLDAVLTARAVGAVGDQRAGGLLAISSPSADSWASQGASGQAITGDGSAAEATNADKALKFTVQMGTASANAELLLEGYALMHIKS